MKYFDLFSFRLFWFSSVLFHLFLFSFLFTLTCVFYLFLVTLVFFGNFDWFSNYFNYSKIGLVSSFFLYSVFNSYHSYILSDRDVKDVCYVSIILLYYLLNYGYLNCWMYFTCLGNFLFVGFEYLLLCLLDLSRYR